MHTNPDLLALLALGEDVGTEEDLVHLAECPACRAELAALTAAAGTARRSTERDVLVAPRPEVWQRISRDLHLHAVARRPRRR
jgi:predicted anti-sigma-YlaC factor YlaD